LRNDSSNAIAAAQVWLKGLKTNVTVYNAEGKTANGHPYVLYNHPLAADTSVDLVIEYLRPTRVPFPSPTFFTNAIAPKGFAAPGGDRRSILRAIPIGPGRILVEFATKRGLQYAVQYSDDHKKTWKTAHPPATANADRVFWLDYGEPKTEGTPTSSRLYRIVQLF